MSQSANYQIGKAHLHAVAALYLPKTASQYRSVVFCGDLPVSSLGFSIDPKPFQGKVVQVGEKWTIVKERGAMFCVALNTLLSVIPNVGDSVTLTPHARRRFDGSRIDDPVSVATDGPFVTKTYHLGEYRSFLPIPKQEEIHLEQMIDQIERMREPNSYRTLAQILVDAKAQDFVAQMPEQSNDFRPTIGWRVGDVHWALEWVPGKDLYDFVSSIGGEILRRSDVYFDDLPQLFTEYFSKDGWNKIHVNVVKAAKPVKPTKLRTAHQGASHVST